MTSKCTSIVAHFEGLADAPVQYKAHHPMQYAQGCTGSHWVLPLGDYLLCIAPAAARATETKQQQRHKLTLLAVLMAMAMRRYVTAHIARWTRSRASLEATGRHHWATIMSNNIKGTYLHWLLLMFFIVNTLKMGV
jgi:hypothetical protein